MHYLALGQEHKLPEDNVRLMSFQLQLVIPLDPVDPLLGWKEPPPPLSLQHRARRYEVVLSLGQCNSEYPIIAPFLLSFYGH